jgi:broad specificity phosphatase PhoE
VLEGQPRALRVRGVTPPGAETPEAYANRVLAGLAKIDGAAPLIVAHSGVFRVLCNTLGVPEPVDPVSNARPVHCLPPDASHSEWRFEFL